MKELSAPWAKMRMPAGRREMGRRDGGGETVAGAYHSGGATVPMTQDSCSICATHPHILAAGQTACAAPY